MSMETKEVFHAREFCRLTGVTGETLRHYVDKGIISPSDIEANNYKLYSTKNALDMLLARSCRGLDLSISTILSKTNATLEEQEAIFAAREREIETEIDTLKQKLARVRQQKGNLNFIHTSLGKVKEHRASDVFNLYRLIVFGKASPITAKEQTILDQWMNYPHYVCVALNAPRESLVDPSIERLPISIGVGVREEWANALGLNTNSPVSFFAKSRGLCTVVSTYDPFNLKKRDLNGIFDEAEQRGAEIASDLTGLLCTYTDTARGRLYYISLGFSIK